MAASSDTDRGLHVVVVANGEFRHPRRLETVLDAADAIVAADGAATWLVAHGRPPHLLVGDMDSIDPALLASLTAGGCRLVRHPTHKDETDTELALHEAVVLGARRITILGALGGRIDHAMANIMLLLMPVLAGVDTAIYDGRSRLFLIRGDNPCLGAAIAEEPGDVEGVRTEGLEYPLRDETLACGPARGVSNVFLGAEVRVALRRGILLAVHTPRRHLEEE